MIEIEFDYPVATVRPAPRKVKWFLLSGGLKDKEMLLETKTISVAVLAEQCLPEGHSILL
ncbi:MAG: hypothetical protein ACYCXK_02355 [Candidatus Humimicrobiaceae bacterium]